LLTGVEHPDPSFGDYLMDPIMILLALGALLVIGCVLFTMFRRWSTMPAATTTTTSLAQIPPELANDEEIRRLVAQGNKIQAIKRVRELTSLGLKEAKDYVDRLPVGSPPGYAVAQPAVFVPDAALEQAVQQMLAHRQKIQAIKRVRELTGLGLKEAKDYVDAVERRSQQMM
jgi:ribosomal protein L7/L12